jgi:glutathione peroxidase
MTRLCSLLFCAAALVSAVSAAEPNLFTIPVQTIDGKDTTLQPYAGKVLLIVNTASQCGFTPQYEGLEALWSKYQGQGLEVLGFPANDFGAQEPGSNAEIKQFCTSKFHVTFPMFSKIHVKGSEQHPLYAALTGPASPKPGPVGWNFNKFLISRDGKILAHFQSETEPDSATLTQAIETALKAK